jgi:hypothetical protein
MASEGDMFAAIAGALAVVFEKQPCRTSRLTGRAFVEELVQSDTNPRRFMEVLRMQPATFEALCKWFEDSGLLQPSRKGFWVEEQVAIFLFIVGHGASNRDAQDRFQHSGETISR